MGMTAEERADEIMVSSRLDRLAITDRKYVRGWITDAIRAAELEAEQRGKAAGLTMTQATFSERLEAAMTALHDLHADIVGEQVKSRATPGGKPDADPRPPEILEAILSAHYKAEQRGAKRERTWMAELHRSYFARELSLKKFLEAIHARGKQTEPA